MDRNELTVLRSLIKEEMKKINQQLLLIINGMQIILNVLKETNEQKDRGIWSWIKKIRGRAHISGKVKPGKASISGVELSEASQRIHDNEGQED